MSRFPRHRSYFLALVIFLAAQFAIAQFSWAVPSPVEWERNGKIETTLARGQKKAKVTFRFTNVAEVPIAITSVMSGCGCTIPSYTEEVIAPGSQGDIVLEYTATSPGQGRVVSTAVFFSTGAVSDLVWNVASAEESPLPDLPEPPEVEPVRWRGSDKIEAERKITLPSGTKVTKVASPLEVSATANQSELAPDEYTIKIVRNSPDPFWSSVVVETMPPLKTPLRIDVRALPDDQQ